jgi:hypothetical protein
LPLEKDAVLAKAYLEAMKDRVGVLSGSEKRSAVRIVNNLEDRMERYRQYAGPVGYWTLGVVFYTERAEQVELLSHEILGEYRTAPRRTGPNHAFT